jgi:hypothetical protein
MRVVAVALCLLLAAVPARAQGTVEGQFTLGGKVVPLPAGSWRVVTLLSEPARTSDLINPITYHRAVLVQERAGRAAAVIYASAATEAQTVWNPHAICTSTTALRRHVAVAVRGNLDCRGLLMVGSGRSPGTPAWLNAFYDEGESRPGWIPPRWLSAQVVLSEGMHLLNVEYRFAPSVYAPQTISAVNWSEGARNAAQQAFVDRLDAWSAEARAELRRGLYGRAPAAPLPAPF